MPKHPESHMRATLPGQFPFIHCLPTCGCFFKHLMPDSRNKTVMPVTGGFKPWEDRYQTEANTQHHLGYPLAYWRNCSDTRETHVAFLPSQGDTDTGDMPEAHRLNGCQAWLRVGTFPTSEAFCSQAPGLLTSAFLSRRSTTQALADES